MTGIVRISRTVVVLLTLVAVSAHPVQSGSPQGHLVIIGGGDRTDKITGRFVELAGPKERAKIVLIPMASSEPETTAAELTSEFKSYGFKTIVPLVITRAQAMKDSTVALLEGATGVYFSGGLQSRLAAVLVGTPVQTKLLQLYARGAVIGGTSAGAAIMSKVMITGNELLHPDTTDEEDPKLSFTFVKGKNIETIEGLGFLQNEIIDQHFVARKRHNRLLSMALEHPRLLGIGIDESTAIIVNPDRTFEVLGEGTVVVYDASHVTSIKTDRNGNLSGHDIRVSILSTGERFEMKSKRVVNPRGQYEGSQ